jgi:hypothetical protein
MPKESAATPSARAGTPAVTHKDTQQTHTSGEAGLRCVGSWLSYRLGRTRRLPIEIHHSPGGDRQE